jgi:hypothetical protein
MRVKPLAADDPMTLWSAAGGDAAAAMKGASPSPTRERRDVGARAHRYGRTFFSAKLR